LIAEIVGSNIARQAANQQKSACMRIRILRRPSVASVDGLPLDRFQKGCLYDVGTTLGILLLAEGWAEPVNEESALLVPASKRQSQRSPSARGNAAHRNLVHETRASNPSIPDPVATGAEFSSRTGRRRHSSAARTSHRSPRR
jgi:hypothetical protein